MAGKKPAKVNSSNRVRQVDSPGKATLYMGLGKGTSCVCPACGSKTGRGIMYDYLNELYCSKTCIRTQLMVL